MFLHNLFTVDRAQQQVITDYREYLTVDNAIEQFIWNLYKSDYN